MRIFLDTNVLASGLATRGLCTELIECVISNHEPLTCEAVLLKLQRILAQKFHLPKPVIREYLDLLRNEGRVVTAKKNVRVQFKDPDDIPILACAISAKADVFVTGDKALLELRKIKGIPILSPRQLWQKLTGLA